MSDFFSRLANKLIITFTLIIFVFIVVLIFVSYNRTNKIIVDDFIHSNQSILQLLNINFENYMAQIDELTITFRKNTQFMNYITNGSWDETAEEYIQNQIKILFYSRNDIETMRFYIPSNGKLYSISQSSDKLSIGYYPNLIKKNWYQKSTKGEFFRFIEPLSGSGYSLGNSGKSVFTFHRALVSIPGLRPLGILSISFNHLALDKMFKSTLNQNGEEIWIVDKNNRFFYSCGLMIPDTAAVRNITKAAALNPLSRYSQIEIKQRKYLAVFNHSQHREWTIIKLIPMSQLKSKGRQIRNLNFLIGIIFIILFNIIIIIVSHTITSPLSKLTKQMDEVGAGNFNAERIDGGSYEIIHLSKKFNEMVGQINELVNEKYLAQINEKTARLKALEAQIHPHFLYNTLQAIAAKAIMEGRKDISRMIESLAYILRYCIKGGEMVRMSEEIEHIRRYLTLQKIRYGDRLSVEIQLEAEISDILIPKLSIQTLVENSVQHALENMTQTMTISIRTYAEDRNIVIKVTDNGPGMTKEHLRRVVQEMEGPWLNNSDRAIGLKNLYSRLKLKYGEDVQLTIGSESGQGTEATIVIPDQPFGGERNV